MTEQYPFFRDADERARAVIGEEAARADLDGEYQKPYAVLTQKRLYCKNEQGNFITDAAGVRSAGEGRLPGQNWFLWAVVACLTLALGLLSLWYFKWGGAGRLDGLRGDAGQIIDHYQSVESEVPEIEEKLRYYEEAQKARDEAQKEWDEKGYSAVRGRIETLTSARDKQKELNESYQAGIEEAQETIESTQDYMVNGPGYLAKWQEDLAYAYEMKAQHPESHNWDDIFQFAPVMIPRIQENLRNAPGQLEQARRDLEQYEALLPEGEEKLKDIQQELNGLQPQKTAMEEVSNRIKKNQASMDSIRYDEHRMTLENHQADAPRYQAARSARRVQGLVMPLLLAMIVAFVVLLSCAMIKSEKAAVFAAWAVSLLGVALCWILSALDRFGGGNSLFWRDTFVLYILLAASLAALALSLPALWWDRKRTAFRVTHATGAFYFIPGLYPAEELENFTAQVEGLKTEDAVHA